MNSPLDTLAFSLEAARMMLNRFTEDLKPEEYLHRPVPKANCAAWTIGHLIMAERRLGSRIGPAFPEIPAGFERRFAREEGAPQAAEFGDVTILRPLFNAHRDATIAAVKALPIARLLEPVQSMIPTVNTLGELIAFMPLHQVMHVGQITIIRRSLGRPPIV